MPFHERPWWVVALATFARHVDQLPHEPLRHPVEMHRRMKGGLVFRWYLVDQRLEDLRMAER